MSLPARIVLPKTKEGETVRRYAIAQTDASYFGKDQTPFFAEDMVFNGLLFKAAGRDGIVPIFANFVENKIVSVRSVTISAPLLLLIYST